MQQEFLNQSSWQFLNVMNSGFDQLEFDGLDVDALLSASNFQDFTDHEFDISPTVDYGSEMISVDDFLREMEVESFESSFNQELDCLLSESEGNFPSEEPSGEGFFIGSPSFSIGEDSSLMLPREGSELDNRLSMFHLLKAYAEAIEKGQRELGDVILRSVSGKVSPGGEVLERLVYNLSRDSGKEREYLRQESCKNFEEAFRMFYQVFPYGRFAHFSANSAILEALPVDAGSVHIVDFDIGEGIQWPPVLEAFAQLGRAVRLTAVKWRNHDSSIVPTMWSFDKTKQRLIDHAKSCGLMLKMDEIEMEDLITEMKRTKKRGGRKEWFVFNCMVGLPHMGRVRSRKLVRDFLTMAKDNLITNKGVLTLSDGDNYGGGLKSCSGFQSFFEENLVHYQALLESIQSNWPIHLVQARMVMECLFIAPYVSSYTWIQKWTEAREDCEFQGLKGLKVSEESLEEAKELVNEKQNLYAVRIGESENQMIFEWKGTALVRVWTWRN